MLWGGIRLFNTLLYSLPLFPDEKVIIGWDYGFDRAILAHHFLMMAVALRSWPCLDPLAHFYVNFDYFPFLGSEAKQMALSFEETNIAALLFDSPYKIGLFIPRFLRVSLFSLKHDFTLVALIKALFFFFWSIRRCVMNIDAEIHTFALVIPFLRINYNSLKTHFR